MSAPIPVNVKTMNEVRRALAEIARTLASVPDLNWCTILPSNVQGSLVRWVRWDIPVESFTAGSFKQIYDSGLLGAGVVLAVCVRFIDLLYSGAALAGATLNVWVDGVSEGVAGIDLLDTVPWPVTSSNERFNLSQIPYALRKDQSATGGLLRVKLDTPDTFGNFTGTVQFYALVTDLPFAE